MHNVGATVHVAMGVCWNTQAWQATAVFSQGEISTSRGGASRAVDLWPAQHVPNSDLFQTRKWPARLFLGQCLALLIISISTKLRWMQRLRKFGGEGVCPGAVTCSGGRDGWCTGRDVMQSLWIYVVRYNLAVWTYFSRNKKWFHVGGEDSVSVLHRELLNVLVGFW